MHFFDERLATHLGVNEAIFMQNLYYLSKKELLAETLVLKKEIWINISNTKIQELQPYFTRSTIRTITSRLIKFKFLEKKQLNKKQTNTLSYSLTDKAWIIMFSLENKENRKNLKKSIQKLECLDWLNLASSWLKSANDWLKLTNHWSNLTKDWLELTNIIIDNRFLIDINRKNYFETTFENEKLDVEIDMIINKNKIFEKRITKTFSEVSNFKNNILYDAVQKYGVSDVLKALEKTSETFLQHNSPVALFFANLTELQI